MNYTKFDLITVGDSTIDTFIKIHDATVEFNVNHQEGKICVAYGAKIPVDSISEAVAGNAANVAVAAAKLGLKSAIYTNLGDDDHARRIKEALEKEKVATDYIKINPGKKSNLSTVLTFQGERTIFVYHQDWFYHLPDLVNCSWLYLTSVAETFTNSNIMDEICHYVERQKSKLVFSPGTYQLKADIRRYPRILEKCAVLIVNREESKKILGVDVAENVNIGDLLNKLLFLGPEIVVITDGEDGSYAADGQKNLKVGVFPTKIVEKTGAGDAYAAGLVACLALGESLAEAMVWGTINAAHVIQEIGPQNGLLTLAELKKHRKEAKELVAVEF